MALLVDSSNFRLSFATFLEIFSSMKSYIIPGED